MNKWALGTVVGSALLAVSKRSSGSSAKPLRMPNKGICEIKEVIFTENKKSFSDEDVEYLENLLLKRCQTIEECLEQIEILQNTVLRAGVNIIPIKFTFPKKMITSIQLLSFDPGLSAEKELEGLLREIVPKTWAQDKHNVRFFLQDYLGLGEVYDDETGEYVDGYVTYGNFYDRLDSIAGFEWDQNIPEGNGGNEVKPYRLSSEKDWNSDVRELVLNNIMVSVWVDDPILRDRIIQFMYSCVIVHALKSIIKDNMSLISLHAGNKMSYGGWTYPNIQIISNGFFKFLKNWNEESPVEKLEESINHFANIRSDKLFKMLISSDMTIEFEDGLIKECTITLQDSFQKISFTSELDEDSLSNLILQEDFNVSGYIETEIGYRTGWIELFAYVKEVETNYSPYHFIDVMNKTPQWFQDWYRSLGKNKEKIKLRKR